MNKTIQILEAALDKNSVKLKEHVNDIMKHKASEALAEKRETFFENLFKDEEETEDEDEESSQHTEEVENIDEVSRTRALAAQKKASEKAKNLSLDMLNHEPRQKKLAAKKARQVDKFGKYARNRYINDSVEEDEELETIEEARAISQKATDAFLNRKKFKQKNMHVHDEDGVHVMKLHGNTIARHHPDGKIEVSHAGWNTPTTRERTNAIASALGHGKPFYQKNHALKHDGKDLDADEWVTLKHGAPKQKVKW